MDERWERLLETQHRINTEKMRAKVSRVLDVIVDVGDIITVKITEADDYDLTGILAY